MITKRLTKTPKRKRVKSAYGLSDIILINIVVLGGGLTASL